MSELVSQVELANQLSNLLSSINEKMSEFKTLSRDQATFASQLSNSFRESSQSYEKIAGSSQSISVSVSEFSQNLEKTIGNKDILGYFDEYSEKMEDLTEKYESTSKTTKGLTEATDEASKAAEKNTSALDAAIKKEKNSLNKLHKANKDNLKALTSVGGSLSNLTEAHNEFAEAADKATSASNKFASAMKSGLSAGIGALKVIGSIIGLAANFFKTAFSLPFMVLDNVVKLGNALRQDIAVTIEQAAQDSKEFFDSFSNIGQGIRKMTSMGKGMLKTFEMYNSSAVKLFGEGASGIANMIKETTESVKNMGHYSELFGQSITRNKDSLFHYTRIKRIMGLTADQEAYYAQDAGVNLISVNDRLTTVTLKLDETSKEFGVDMKRLSKNFNVMRKEIAIYGHLSDAELMRTTSRLTQMKISVEDAGAVFKKFNTFEDAANSVAMLSQTFGMNLDAMDIIKAKNPEEIINMFRDSMISTGRTFDELNRFEKQIMADQTGMSQEGLKALMTLRDKGLTHQEAVDQMKDQTPEARQLKAIKELSSSMKLLQRIMTFTSPFEAFMKGLGKNAAASSKARKAFMSLSNTYQMIHDFAINLDGDTVAALTEPVILIVNVMKDIFASDAFKGGLRSLVAGFGELATSVFGITDSDKVYYEVQDSLKRISKEGKKTLLYEIEKNVVLDENLTEGTRNLWEKFKNNKKFSRLSTSQKFTKYLAEVKKRAANDPAVKKDFDALMKGFSQGYNFVSLNRKIKDKKDSAEVTQSLTERAQNTLDASKGNFSAFFDISGSTLGAILKGAAILVASGLNVLNYTLDQVDADKMTKKSGGKSLLESFFDWDAGELSEIGTIVGDALGEVFKRGGKLFFFGTWILEQFSYVVLEIGGVFWDVFKSLARQTFPSFFDTEKTARDINYEEIKKGKSGYKSMQSSKSFDELDYGSYAGKYETVKKLKNVSKAKQFKGSEKTMKRVERSFNEDTLDAADMQALTLIEAMQSKGQGNYAKGKTSYTSKHKDLEDILNDKKQMQTFEKAMTMSWITASKNWLKKDWDNLTLNWLSNPKNNNPGNLVLKDTLDKIFQVDIQNAKLDKSFVTRLIGENFDLLTQEINNGLDLNNFNNQNNLVKALEKSVIDKRTNQELEARIIKKGKNNMVPKYLSDRLLGLLGEYDAGSEKTAFSEYKIKDGFFNEMFAVKPGGAIDNLMTSLGYVSSNANEAMAIANYGSTGLQKTNSKYTREEVKKNIENLKKIKENLMAKSEEKTVVKVDSESIKPLMIALASEGMLDTMMRPDIISKSTLRINGDACTAGSYQDGRPAQFSNEEYPEGIMS